ncbi:MAG: ribosomal L7Ae/L30e/S12e/Gadd45 family protein [Lachnospiraceae bacterium]|nr:ribosomal L7Ae/L30e/S12e/Gadd45 family protein [Lachnospiraceae bacterium]
MGQDKVLNMLGLSSKGGNIQSGEFMTESSVKAGRSSLVIIASDASDNTKKMFKDMCSYYNTEFRIYSDKVSLGRAIGKEFRASISVTDKGLADKIIGLIDNNNDRR